MMATPCCTGTGCRRGRSMARFHSVKYASGRCRSSPCICPATEALQGGARSPQQTMVPTFTVAASPQHPAAGQLNNRQLQRSPCLSGCAVSRCPGSVAFQSHGSVRFIIHTSIQAKSQVTGVQLACGFVNDGDPSH